MSPSISGRVSRFVLFSVVVCSVLTACDLTAPLDPDAAKTTMAPTDASFTASASNLSATVVSWSEIDIAWASNPSASGYQIFRSTSGPAGNYEQIATIGPAARTYANTGLNGSTNYCYQVRSFKSAGKNVNLSTFVGPVCATTAPPPVVAPSETDAVPRGGYIQVKWKDNSSDEDGFHIEQSASATGPWTQAGNANANAVSFSAYAVTEQRACFRVIAFNTIGPSPPSTPDCTVLPVAPTNLEVKTIDGQSLTLTWSDNSAAEDGYEIRRRDPSGSLGLIATMPANTTSYRDGAVTTDAAYTYQVQAIKDGGYSHSSNEAVGVIALTPPAAPQNAVAVFTPDYEGYGWLYFSVYWTDASTNEQGFRIDYSSDGVSGWQIYTTTGPGITYIQQVSDIFSGYPAPSGCYRVIAFNNRGDSPPSNVSCAEFGAGPTDLVATSPDDHSINLNWKDNAAFETGYAVLRWNESDWTVLAYVPASSTSYSDRGLNAGEEHFYVVAATYDFYWSEYSNVASAIVGQMAGLRTSADLKLSRSPAAPLATGKRVPRFVRPLPSINPRP